jgi:hypothetical protein
MIAKHAAKQTTPSRVPSEMVQSEDQAGFAFAVVPLNRLRNTFIVYNTVLLYANTANWSTTLVLANTGLLVIFLQSADISIFAMVLRVLGG